MKRTKAALNEELLDAVLFFDVRRAKRALAGGANPNLRDGSQTMLHSAAMQGHVGLVKALIEAGANVDAKSGTETPLDEAADSLEALSLAKLFIKAGAKVTPAIVNSYAYAGKTEALELLLDHAKLSPSCRDARRMTPLHWAALSGALATVKRLLALGADPTLKCSSKQTPLDIAREHDHAKVVALLAKQTSTDVEISAEAMAKKFGARVAKHAIEGGDWQNMTNADEDPWTIVEFAWDAEKRAISNAITASGVKGAAAKRALDACCEIYFDAFTAEARRRGKR